MRFNISLAALGGFSQRSNCWIERTRVAAKSFSQTLPSKMCGDRQMNKASDVSRLRPFDSEDESTINVVVETPMGSRNKFKYDTESGLYKLSKVLPQGMVFPAAFGFVPSTLGQDGDPEDVLVLLDEPVFAGCLVPSRLIGVIEAEQTEKKKTSRNDRLIAAAASSREHADIKSLADLPRSTVEEIEHFFINYNREASRQFRVLGTRGPKHAIRILEKSMDRYKRKAA
jgi:inorganic pyrophosphatase